MKYLNFRLIRGLIIGSTSVIIIISACDNFLMEKPESSIAPSNFYKTEDDAVAAVNAIYDTITQFDANAGGLYHNEYWVITGVFSDNLKNNPSSTNDNEDNMSQFKLRPTNSEIEQYWQDSYTAINTANLAIKHIPPIENINEDLKNRLLGEARFLRGIVYFDLVRMYGGNVPRPLQPAERVDDEHLMPSSKDSIYSTVIEDLKFAESHLPPEYGQEKGRATSGAATSVLAKVYLFRKNYAQAAAEAKKVIDSKRYSLWSDFKEAFLVVNGNGKESVFDVQFHRHGQYFWESGQFNVRFLPGLNRNGEGPQNGQEWELPTEDLYNSFKNNDARKDATFITSFTYSDGKTVTFDPHISKYWDREAEPLGSDSSVNFPYIRYSDVLLIYAEASNELNDGPIPEAYDALNQVHTRAGLTALSGLTKEQFRKAVWQERRWEFVAEGQRWFDLVRQNRLVQRVKSAKPKATPQEYHNLLPIPQRELDQNKNLQQNPGY